MRTTKEKLMEPLLLSVDEAAKALSIGKTKLYSELSLGKIEAAKLGKRTLISRESLRQYLENLDTYPAENAEV